MSKKLTQDFVENEFLKNGCKLLDIYIKNSIPMKYICSCGRQSSICWMSFKAGSRCKDCKIEKLRNDRQFDFEYVFNFYQQKNCKLLETQYINATIPMRYICSCGKESVQKFHHFKSGVRCKDCGIQKQKRLGAANHLWQEDREKVEKYQYYRRKCKDILKHCLTASKKSKCDKTYNLLNFTPLDLKEKIESHPKYLDSLKNNQMSIDHIFPVKAFVEHGFDQIDDIKLINDLDNLQPMDLRENISKNDTYNPQDFVKYLRNKGIEIKINPYNVQ